MQVENTKRIQERIARLIYDRNFNGNINRFLTSKIGRNVPKDMDALAQAGESCRKLMEEKGAKITAEQGQILSMVLDGAKEHVEELFKNEADEAAVLAPIAILGRVFDSNTFAENPYIRDVHLNSGNAGEYRFGLVAFRPGQQFFYNTPVRGRGRCIDLPRVAFFKEEARFPGILKDGRAYQSVTPNEMLTMEPHIRAASGDVLALGLGMGYFAYMASLKENVRSVTVVENDPALIELFEEHIAPQLKTGDKIRILEDDPREFLSDLDDEIYTRCFVQNPKVDDYLYVTEFEKRFSKMKITYWIEDAFCLTLDHLVYFEILRAFSEAGGLKDLKLPVLPEADQRRQEKISELLKDIKISRPEQIDYYMDPANLAFLIR